MAIECVFCGVLKIELHAAQVKIAAQAEAIKWLKQALKPLEPSEEDKVAFEIYETVEGG